MGILSWILFGAVAGWAASLILGRNRQMGCLANVFVGIIGAMVGGFVMNLIGREAAVTGFNWPSFGVAVLGAVIFLGITGLWQRRS